MYSIDVKHGIRTILENNTNHGEYDGKSFIIFDGWNDIRKINTIMGYSDEYDYRTGYDTLNLDLILSWINTELPFPITQDDINQYFKNFEFNQLIHNGQLSFMDNSKRDLMGMELIHDQILEYVDSLNPIIDNDSLDYLNSDIKDKLDSQEWGFSDEYSNCGECYNTVLRILPDSYGWTADYYLDNEYRYICSECAQDYMDQAIDEIQDRIDNEQQPKSFPWIFNLDDTWIKINHPDGYEFSKWQNGLHRGMNDDPLRQGKIIRSLQFHGDSIFQVIFRIYPNQFNVNWDTYFRLGPNSDLVFSNEDMNNISNELANRFNSDEGQFPYDIASLYEDALKNLDVNFASINVDPNTGIIDIQGSNDLDEYLENIKQ